MAAAHKSAISIGLLYIPVGLYRTTRDISVSFNQLCKDSFERVRYKKYCPSCQKEVKNEDIIKGYEFEKGRYVTISEEELERIKTRKDKTIHIEHFARMTEVDPIYYEKNYYLSPEPGAEKAYELLRQAMLSSKMAAIAKTVIGSNEQLLVLYPTKEIIMAKTLFYQEEIQDMPKTAAKASIQKSELEMAKTMIEAMRKNFDITAYHDEYQARLRAAIEAKIRGQEVVSADSGTPGNIIDLMEAMKRTVELSQKQRGTA